MMTTIGQYLIEPLSNNQWRISWHNGGGRTYITIIGLESKLRQIIDEILIHQDAFVKLFECAMLESPDIFVDKYPLFMNHVPEENIDPFKMTDGQKYDYYLRSFLAGYNNLYGTQIRVFDIEAKVAHVRRKMLSNEK